MRLSLSISKVTYTLLGIQAFISSLPLASGIPIAGLGTAERGQGCARNLDRCALLRNRFELERRCYFL